MYTDWSSAKSTFFNDKIYMKTETENSLCLGK